MSTKISSVSIPILNSLTGKGYTSLHAANQFVRRGKAEIVDGKLVFKEQAFRAAERHRNAVEMLEESILRDRSGVIWHNGCDHRRTAMHKPGENVMFPRL